MNVSELKEFFETELGKHTCIYLRNKISQIWPYSAKEKILGFGFTLPYLPLFTYNNTCISVTPPNIGAMKIEGGSLSVMAEGETLPLRNEYFDRILIVHGLENCEMPEKLLQEAWRILKPSGKLIIIAPHEDSFWKKGLTPFSQFKGYRRSKIVDYLSYNKFAVKRVKKALFFYPTRYKWINNFGEYFFGIFFRQNYGVIIAEAEKLIFAPGGRPIKIAPSIFDKIFKPKAAIAETKDIA